MSLTLTLALVQGDQTGLPLAENSLSDLFCGAQAAVPVRSLSPVSNNESQSSRLRVVRGDGGEVVLLHDPAYLPPEPDPPVSPAVQPVPLRRAA